MPASNENCKTRTTFCLKAYADIITDVEDTFLNITGYLRNEILHKKVKPVLNELLRINLNIHELETIQVKKPCFLFTKSLKAVQAFILVSQGATPEEKTYMFEVELDLDLDRKIIFIEQLFAENVVGIGIYSIPDLILLKANQRYLSFLDDPYKEIENSLGKHICEMVTGWKGSPSEAIWNTVLNTGKVYYVKEFMYDRFERGITYWDATISPVFEDGRLKYLVENAVEVTEGVLNRHEMKKKLYKGQLMLD